MKWHFFPAWDDGFHSHPLRLLVAELRMVSYYGGFRFVMGVPPVLIHFSWGFSMKETIQLWATPIFRAGKLQVAAACSRQGALPQPGHPLRVPEFFPINKLAMENPPISGLWIGKASLKIGWCSNFHCHLWLVAGSLIQFSTFIFLQKCQAAKRSNIFKTWIVGYLRWAMYEITTG